MEQQTQVAETAEVAEKKPYEMPTLTSFGALADVTLTPNMSGLHPC
jgi:hypothetical protein